jgi:ribosomal protein S18 acetylase RimI-like enzyme
MSMQAVQLIQVTDAEYAELASQQIVEYARQLERAGEVSVGDSLAVSQARLVDLSADRLRAAGHVFFVARSARDASRVGWVWLSPAPGFLGPGHDGSRWLSQITVDEPLRGYGWGRAILVAAERHLAAVGVEQLWLRVFEWNTAARALYDSLGYELVRQFPLDAHLRKQLSQLHE